MSKRTLLSLLLIAVVVVAGVGFLPGLIGGDDDGDSVRTGGIYTVKRQSLEITLVETGHLKAKESQSITAPLENRQVTIVGLVEEGKVVEEGEELVRFDDKEVKKRVEDLEQSRIDLEAALKSARSELEIKQSTTVNDLEKAKLAVENTEKELEKTQEGSLELERLKLDIRMRETEFQVTRLGKKLDDMRRVHEEEGMFSADAIEETRIALDKAKDERKSAELEDRIFEEFTKKMDVAKRKADLQTARINLESSTKRAEAEIAGAEANLRKAERRLERNTEQLEEARENLEKMVILSPGAGIVVFGNPDQPWRDTPRVGGTFYHQETIMTLPYLSEMQVNFDIHESDIAKIEVGQAARVTLEMDNDLELTAKVTKVGALATGGGWREDSNIRKFQCEVSLDQKDTGHKPGLTSKVEILIETLQDVLVVPLQAVHTREGKHVVYMAPASQSEKREVEVGSSNATHVEITSGLEEGDQVLLYDPVE